MFFIYKGIFFLMLSFGGVSQSIAGLLDFQGEYQTELEERSAVSNQRVYDELKQGGCQDADRLATQSCTGDVFSVWQNVRELVHTANELSGNSEPTEFSLGLALDGLGFALRWTAGEEFATQESLSSNFVSGQLSGLASRISALRGGSRGFTIAGIVDDNETISQGYLPGNDHSSYHTGDVFAQFILDVAALKALDFSIGKEGVPIVYQLSSDDDQEKIDKWSRLGGFINANYTYGNQGPSEREDAFYFDGAEINGGIDYRLDKSWVVGSVFGYQQDEIDFDSDKSIVDGNVEMVAFSLMPFLLYQTDSLFFSFSSGYQQADFETVRSIRYPSLNPDIESIDTTAKSDNTAKITTLSLLLGYNIQLAAMFSVEPSFSVNYQNSNIDGYKEKDLKNDGFNFVVDDQNVESLETVAGFNAKYVLSNNYGVFVPYVNIKFYSQHKNSPQVINAAYVGAGNFVTEGSKFSLPTDAVDKEYFIYSAGFSAVIRGSRIMAYDFVSSGGVQIYFNIRKIDNVGNYNQKIFSGGLRYEF